jgi:TonB-linked SusC/RagA family outer membrane protein
VRSNINSSPTKWMNLGVNVFGGHDRRQTNQYGSNSLNRGLALLSQPYYTPNDPATGKPYEFIPGLGRYHPYYLEDKMPSQSGNLQINPSGYVQIMPIKNLTLKTTAGFEFYDYRTSSIRYPSYAGSLNVGSVTESFARGMTRNINNTIEYNFKIKGIHSVSALAGQEWIDYKYDDFSANSTGQTDDRLVLLPVGTTSRDVTQSKTEYAFLSYFGRISYNFDSKYFLDATLRQDQSSRFGRDNRSANFWSIGAMWNMKKERFLTNVKWLTDATLKFSIGTSGNSAIGNYDALALVGTNSYEGTSGWGVSDPGNNELSWESQRQINIGAKFTLFNRGHFEIDLYDRRTTNMLVSVPYPFTSGFSTIRDNVGELQNSGIDVMADWDIIRTKDAYLTPTINFNYNKNEVLELFQGRKYWSITNTGVGWIVGQPVSFIYPVFSGINPQTGNPEWYLPNAADITVPTRDKGVTSTFVTANLQQNTGIKRFPPFTGGFGLNAGYKGFYFNTDFSFAQGKYLINNDRYFFENPTAFPGFNQSTAILDYWKQPGDIARFPRINYAVAGGLVQFTQFDSRLIEDASFLRIKNMTVGYVVPKKVTDRTGFIKGAKFYVTGRNLVTWTKYTGPDPEVDSNLTLGVNPNTKQVSVGLDLNF